MTLINQGWRVKLTNDSSTPAIVSGTVATLNGFEIPAHDYISMSYSGSNVTGVVYKDGGASGTVVATLSLSYDVNNNLISATKS